MAVGQALTPEQQPNIKDPPKKSVGQAINPEGGRSRMKEIMNNPAMLAFLAQAAASLFSGRGVGGALGDATGALGRGAAAVQQYQTGEEREQRRRFESDREFELRRMQALGLGGGGRGGGGGSGSGDGSGGVVDEKELRKFMLDRAKEEYELAVDNAQLNGTEPPPPPNYAVIADEARRLATASRNGMDMRQYNDILQAGGEDAADDMVDAYRQGKELGDQWVDGVLNWQPTPQASPDVPGGGASTPGMPMPGVGRQAPSINAPQRNNVPDVTPNLPGAAPQLPSTPSRVPPLGAPNDEDERLRQLQRMLGAPPASPLGR